MGYWAVKSSNMDISECLFCSLKSVFILSLAMTRALAANLDSTFQVEVVPHQVVGMHLPAGLLASLSQRLEQLLTINIIEKCVLSPAPWIHDVIHLTPNPRTRVL